MPVINWDEHEEAGALNPVPRGKYLAQVVDVQPKVSKEGNELWNLQFEILAPEAYSGRRFYDTLAFTQKALGRVKLACSRMGIDTSGTVNLEPKHLLGRKAVVSLEVSQYTDREGRVQKKNNVTFSGYAEASSWSEAAGAVPAAAKFSGTPQDPFSEENLPF